MPVTFDKLKISLPLSTVEINYDFPEWVYTSTGAGNDTHRLRIGTLKERKTGKSPGLVRPGLNYVEIDLLQQHVTIVLTGKILPTGSLLSSQTIVNAFEAINSFGLITIEIASALREARVHSVDITMDCCMDHAPAEYTRCLSRYYAGKSFVQCRDYAPNIQLQHRSKTPQYQRSLTLYDKCQEAPNAGYHPNTLRVELRLLSFMMMRKYLALPAGEIKLLDVLRSTANPLSIIMAEVARDINLPVVCPKHSKEQGELSEHARESLFCAQELSFAQIAQFCHLKSKDFNLALLRNELKGNKNSARVLKPYKQLLAQWLAYTPNFGHEVQLLRELSKKINISIPS